MKSRLSTVGVGKLGDRPPEFSDDPPIGAPLLEHLQDFAAIPKLLLGASVELLPHVGSVSAVILDRVAELVPYSRFRSAEEPSLDS